jgi:opacity protein-like surface antigen
MRHDEFSRRFEALNWKRTALGSRKFRRALGLAPPDTIAAPSNSALVLSGIPSITSRGGIGTFSPRCVLTARDCSHSGDSNVKNIVVAGALAAGVFGLAASAQGQSLGTDQSANALRAPNPLQLADEPGTPPPRRRRVVRQPPPEEPPPPQPQPVVQPPPRPPPPAPSPWYFLLSAGAAFPSDTDFNALGINGSIKYSTGFHAFGGVGYRFTPWIAAELELGYIHLPIDSISLPGATISVDGSVRGFALFGNLVLTYPEWQTIKPYIAAGPGFVHRFSTDFTATAGGVTATGDIGSATDFAVQAKAGIDFRLTERLSLAPEYRFHWINTAGDGLRNTHVHSVGASLKINF